MDRREMDEFVGPNAGYVAELYERYQHDPQAVDPATRAAFARWGAAPVLEAPPPPPVLAGAVVSTAAGAAALAQAIRYYGHLAARLDPLGAPPPGDPQLEPAAHGIGETELERLPASVVGGPLGRTAGSAAEAIQRLRQIYCGTTGYELGHAENPEERAWLLEAIEEERFRPPADPVDERDLLDRLTEVSAFERFLHRAYPGQTRFSIEGLGILVPMLDELVARAAEAGTRTIVLGMAHRGRLNVLAHVLGKPYADVLAEFEGLLAGRRTGLSESSDEGFTGDVTYHAGGRRAFRAGEEPGAATVPRSVTVVLAPNPSHLEAVDPVVEGMARAAGRPLAGDGESERLSAGAALAVLIHGDAAFPGQGVVAETLNLSGLSGFTTGGTFHLIENNQLGFTTAPAESRSTLYASDLARGFDVPIVHVNADDPIACLAAVRLAVAYRSRFHKDVLVDLVGYRRWGHNEGDEPSFTQPRLYARIAEQPTVRQRFAADLVRRGVVGEDEPEALLRAGLDEFQQIREAVLARGHAADGDGRAAANGQAATHRDRAAARPEKGHADSAGPGGTRPAGGGAAPAGEPALPAVSLDRLRALDAALLAFPEGFTVHPKLERGLQRRRAAFDAPDRPRVDWGHAETLALATILEAGVPIRLSGQDAVRGTFSQRHLTFHDPHTGATVTPLQRLPAARAAFEAVNSPLTENAVLGFEYGFSVQARAALVLWEAQYGDFVDGAQVVVDEFVVSGEAKWGLVSGLVLLLPHAWEGQGPDHSSGRLERFLQLAAEDNLVVASCTTAAQYFHLLRRQAASLRDRPRPLVVMTPKSLLRHPLALARAAELAEGSFQAVLDDPRLGPEPAPTRGRGGQSAGRRRDRVRRVVLCSGKVWADLEAARGGDDDLAVVRVEQLYPFPAAGIGALVAGYSRAREVVWLQEEPRNMGAWTFVEPRLRDVLGSSRRLRYVGRPDRASPAEGWSHVHAAEQRRIVEAVLTEEPPAIGPRRPATNGRRRTAGVSDGG